MKNRVGPGFHHVIAADADGVVFGHVFGAVSDNVGYNPHGRFRWIDIGVSGQVFF